jgi:peptidoglycan pentaglycine glycine transferase (the first glycine)
MNHPLQSSEWGDFREQTGVKVVRKDDIQLTIHNVPNTPWKIGYYPKGQMPTKELIEKLRQIGKEEKCIFIQLEPDVIYKTYKPKSDIIEENPAVERSWYEKLGLVKSAHPLFTKYTFVLDISKPEEELLKQMHAKTRYNIRVAQKNNVVVVEDNSTEAFREYLLLTKLTTARQKFYAHTDKYHKTQWELLPHKAKPGKLSSHLLLAK